MAAGNIIQGQGAGKLGDVVLMVRNGVQVARVYTKAGARTGSAASEASRIQRVRFGSASNQWDLYRYVCTRMYRKGKSGNQSDYNYFVKRNSALLPYLTKQENAEGVHCVMPGQFSEGTLGRIEQVVALTHNASTNVSLYTVSDALHRGNATVVWNSKMSLLKSGLRAFYPAATKVTYLFSFAPQIVEDSEGVEFQSQSISHIPVTIELYNQTRTGEDDMTVVEYFTPYFAGSPLADLIAGQEGTFGGYTSLVAVHGTTTDHYDLLNNLAVMIFATDDNASNCYSTIVPEDGVPSQSSAWSLYFQYRTTEALRLACESYGYQSGVMRDDIAKVGNDLQVQQAAYAARLRSLGLDAEMPEE